MKIINWLEINWKKAYLDMRTIQEKFVLAKKSGNTKNLYCLQRQLVNSYAGRAIAIRKVCSSQFKDITDNDKRLLNSAKKKSEAINQLKYTVNNLMEPLNGKEKFDRTNNTKVKNLINKGMQFLYQMAWDPVIEMDSDISSFGFRQYRTIIDAITRIRTLLNKSTSPYWIMQINISNCFTKKCNDYLVNYKGIIDKKIFGSLFNKEIIKEGFIKKTPLGRKTGGVIASLIWNILLNGLEKQIKEEIGPNRITKKYGYNPKINYIRYGTKLLIIGSTREILENQIKNKLIMFFKERGLKTEGLNFDVRNIKDGFNYLGFEIKRFKTNLLKNQNNIKQNTILIIKPNKFYIQKLKQFIKEIINVNRPIEAIIKELNPVLREWVNYYRI